MPIIYGSSLPPGKDGSTKGEVRIRVDRLLLEEDALLRLQDELEQKGFLSHSPSTAVIAPVQKRPSSSPSKSARKTPASSTVAGAAGAPSVPRIHPRFVIPVHHCAVAPLFFGEPFPSAHCIPTTATENRGTFTLVYPIKVERTAFATYLQSMAASPHRGLQLEVFVPSSYSGRQALPVGRAILDLAELAPRKTISGWFTLGAIMPAEKREAVAEGRKGQKGSAKETRKGENTKEAKKEESAPASSRSGGEEMETEGGDHGQETLPSAVIVPLGRVKLSVSLTYFSRPQVVDPALTIEGTHLVTPPRKRKHEKVPVSPSHGANAMKKEAKNDRKDTDTMEQDTTVHTQNSTHVFPPAPSEQKSAPTLAAPLSAMQDASSPKPPQATSSTIPFSSSSPLGWDSQIPHASQEKATHEVYPSMDGSRRSRSRSSYGSSSSSSGDSSTSTTSSDSRLPVMGGEEHHQRPKRTKREPQAGSATLRLKQGSSAGASVLTPMNAPSSVTQDALLEDILKQGQALQGRMKAAIHGGGGVEAVDRAAVEQFPFMGTPHTALFPSFSDPPVATATGAGSRISTSGPLMTPAVGGTPEDGREGQKGLAMPHLQPTRDDGGRLGGGTALLPPSASFPFNFTGYITQEGLLRDAEGGTRTSEILSRFGLPCKGDGGLRERAVDTTGNGDPPWYRDGISPNVAQGVALKKGVDEHSEASTLYTSEDSDDEERFTVQLQRDMEEAAHRRCSHRKGAAYLGDSEEGESEDGIEEGEGKRQERRMQNYSFTSYPPLYSHRKCYAEGAGRAPVAHSSCSPCHFGVSTRRAGVVTHISLTFSHISFPHNPHTADAEEIRINVRLSQDISTGYPSPGPFSSLVHPLPLSPDHLICLRFDVSGFSERSKLVLEFFKVHSRPILAPGTSLLSQGLWSPSAGHASPPRREVIGETPLGLCIVGLYEQEREIALLDPVENAINAYAHFTATLMSTSSFCTRHRKRKPQEQKTRGGNSGKHQGDANLRNDEEGVDASPLARSDPGVLGQERVSHRRDIHMERRSPTRRDELEGQEVLSEEEEGAAKRTKGVTFETPSSPPLDALQMGFSREYGMINSTREAREAQDEEIRSGVFQSRLHSETMGDPSFQVPVSAALHSGETTLRPHASSKRGAAVHEVTFHQEESRRFSPPRRSDPAVARTTRAVSIPSTGEEENAKKESKDAWKGPTRRTRVKGGHPRRKAQQQRKRKVSSPPSSSSSSLSDHAVLRGAPTGGDYREGATSQKEEEFQGRGKTVKDTRGSSPVLAASAFLPEGSPKPSSGSLNCRPVQGSSRPNRVIEDIRSPMAATAATSPHTCFPSSAAAAPVCSSAAAAPVCSSAAAAPVCSSAAAAPVCSSAAAAYLPNNRLPGRCRIHIAIMGAREIPLIAVLEKEGEVTAPRKGGKGGVESGTWATSFQRSPPPSISSAYGPPPSHRVHRSTASNGSEEQAFKQSSFSSPNIFFVVEEIFSGVDSHTASTGAVPDWLVEASTGGYYDRTDVVYHSVHPTFQYECIVSLPQESVWLSQCEKASPSTLRHAASMRRTISKPSSTEQTQDRRNSGQVGEADLMCGVPTADAPPGSGSYTTSKNAAAARRTGVSRPCLRELQLTMWHLVDKEDKSSYRPLYEGQDEEEVFWSNAAYIGECRVDLRPLKYLPSLQGYYRVTATGHPPLLNPPKMPTLSSTCMGYVHLAISLLPSDER